MDSRRRLTTRSAVLEASRAQAAATKKKNSEAVNVKTIPKRRRNPGEIASKTNSIKWFCIECSSGYESDPGCGTLAQQVRDCTAVNCPLYPWRNGKLETGV